MSGAESAPLLGVRDVHVSFRMGTAWPWRERPLVSAVAGVSFELRRQETLALVGESGSGKTTVARTVVGLQPADAGTAELDGLPIDLRERRRGADVRRRMQMVFQDPYGSLDPRMRIGDQIAEPLAIAGVRRRTERTGRALELLNAVGLPGDAASRYPHQLSGGQRQRVALARSLILRPDVLICDEPVSALDVSIQAQVINLLQDLQEQLGLSYLLISHDLGVVHTIAHRVAIMYLGRIVETGETRAVFARPRHPYTQALISAVRVPRPSIERYRKRVILLGEIPSASSPPSGCRFRTRCPHAVERCAAEVPLLRTLPGSSVLVACHRAEDIPSLIGQPTDIATPDVAPVPDDQVHVAPTLPGRTPRGEP